MIAGIETLQLDVSSADSVALVQDFYTHVVDYIAVSDELNGTAFSNAALDPSGASSPLSGSDSAQLEGLPKLVSQASLWGMLLKTQPLLC